MAISLNRTTTTIGVTSALIASLCFTLNDSGIKFLSGDYPIHEIVLFRSLVGLALVLGLFIPLEGGYHLLKTKRVGLHLVRGFCVVITNLMFFLGIAAIPLAEATAVFFVAPLMITLFSVVFLSEKVGMFRWAAVGLGLFGAIIMLRPGADTFQYAAIFPLFAAIAYAAVHILTRKMSDSEQASTMVFYIFVSFLMTSVLMGLAFGDGRYATGDDPSLNFLLRAWVWPSNRDFLIIVGVGILASSGGYFISQAYRVCEAALIAPFEYTGLVLAVIWGVLLFGEWPDIVAWLGIILVLASGLTVIWRETLLKKRLALARPMPRQR